MSDSFALYADFFRANGVINLTEWNNIPEDQRASAIRAAQFVRLENAYVASLSPESLGEYAAQVSPEFSAKVSSIEGGLAKPPSNDANEAPPDTLEDDLRRLVVLRNVARDYASRMAKRRAS